MDKEMRKMFNCTHLGTFSALCYMYIVFWTAITHKLLIYDVKLKFSVFFSCVKFIQCIKFQIQRYQNIKIGIFRTKLQLKIPIAFRYELHFPRIPICIAKFTIGILGDETGHVLKCLKHYNKEFLNVIET